MNNPVLEQVLAATGYLPDGQPAAGLLLGEQARAVWRGRDFVPDARWRTPSELTVWFKSTPDEPKADEVSRWQREVWNEGFAPLLWVVSPRRIDVYNGFGSPSQKSDGQAHLLRRFEHVADELQRLDAFAGRLAMETGQFWANAPSVHREGCVDQRLLSDLKWLERGLVAQKMPRDAAQGLIGRIIFAQYLMDRRIVGAGFLEEVCGHSSLPAILRHRSATSRLFGWLSETFNGDMFPASWGAALPAPSCLGQVADFLEAVDPDSGQRALFPYRFDIIPVELISSIYEQFAHAKDVEPGNLRNEARRNSVHYTRLPVVSLVLDEVMEGVTGQETVLDLTCGSGIFLVEALRRLVHARAGGQPASRALVRSTLHEQVFGVDISESAIRVAAFSLYLAAMELDPAPHDMHALKFKPLIGSSLLVADARTVGRHEVGVPTDPMAGRTFDVIVGNPPWSFKGQSGTLARRKRADSPSPAQPRGEGLDFVVRVADFAHPRTRFGLVLSAMPFFSRSQTGQTAVQHVLRTLAPVTLVNLSALRSWLFATASMPAMVLFARHRPQQSREQVTVVQVPWTPEGMRTHSFEVSPSDIMSVTLDEITRQPLKLKAAAVGQRRDVWLVEQLLAEHGTLESQLGGGFKAGLIQGTPKNWTRDARHLRGLPLLSSEDMQHFRIPDNLPAYTRSHAQWPRARQTYQAPLLVVKQMFRGGPRPVVAVSERDMIFTDAYHAVTVPGDDANTARLLATLLCSAVGAWFFYMTASEFGIYKEKLLARDVGAFPAPDIKVALASEAGQKLLKIEERFRQHGVDESGWNELDEAVFDVYGFGNAERIIVRDGLLRAQAKWKHGRDWLAGVASCRAEVHAYAETFLSVMGDWLSVRQQRQMHAEVVELPDSSPLRVVRFVLEDGWEPGRVDVIAPQGPLSDVLAQIGTRLRVNIATALSVKRELRIHGPREVFVIKPAARRYWMKGVALEDADAVVAESLSGRMS